VVAELVRMILEMPEIYEYCMVRLIKKLCEENDLKKTYAVLLAKLDETPMILDEVNETDLEYICNTMLYPCDFVREMEHLRREVLEGGEEKSSAMSKDPLPPIYSKLSTPVHHITKGLMVEEKTYEPS
jgi:hypothetical protein